MSNQIKYIIGDYERVSNDQSLISEGCTFLSIQLPEDGQTIIGRNRLHNPLCRCVAIIQLELTAMYSSAYQNNKYKVDILIPQSYPFSPPKVIFKTPIDHINICDLSGLVTHSFLGSEWCMIGFRVIIMEMLQLFTVPRPQDMIFNQPINSSSINQLVPMQNKVLNDLDFFDF